jgi:hypothetical protein
MRHERVEVGRLDRPLAHVVLGEELHARRDRQAFPLEN